MDSLYFLRDPIYFSRCLYRASNVIERFFSTIKNVGMSRPDMTKLAANYLAFINLASIRIWLGANESAP